MRWVANNGIDNFCLAALWSLCSAKEQRPIQTSERKKCWRGSPPVNAPASFNQNKRPISIDHQL